MSTWVHKVIHPGDYCKALVTRNIGSRVTLKVESAPLGGVDWLVTFPSADDLRSFLDAALSQTVALCMDDQQLISESVDGGAF